MIECKKVIHLAETRKLEREIQLFELEERETLLCILEMNILENIEQDLEAEKWRRHKCQMKIKKCEAARNRLIQRVEQHLRRHPEKNRTYYEQLLECLPNSPIHTCV